MSIIFLRSRQYETRNQLQKANWENPKNIESKKHTTSKTMDKWGNQRGSQKLPCKLKMETTLQNLWDSMEVFLKGTFIVVQAFFRKPERSQINNINHTLKELEKE